jgi:D-alanine-D-alanine ligase
MRVAVVFGGRSAEHEISLGSARFVVDSIESAGYEVLPVGIRPDGVWVMPSDLERVLAEGLEAVSSPAVTLSPDPARSGLISESGEITPVDFVFPVIHGTFGEDGTIQGLFEMAGVPYAGSGVLGSALGMDKELSKAAFAASGLPQVEYLALREAGDDLPRAVGQVEAALRYPVIVKPANLGSSVGMSKAHDHESLLEALELAFRYDRKVVVERLADIRNLEVALLGNERPEASVVGEVSTEKGWLDFEAKYADGGSTVHIPADLDLGTSDRARQLAIEAYQAIDCAGLARCDILLENVTGRLYVSEMNTLPGMSEHSTFPLLWQASGVAARELFDRIICHGLERHQKRQALLTSR